MHNNNHLQVLASGTFEKLSKKYQRWYISMPTQNIWSIPVGFILKAHNLWNFTHTNPFFYIDHMCADFTDVIKWDLPLTLGCLNKPVDDLLK